MGQWETERGHGGDGIADYLDIAFKKIGELLNSQYRMIDLADAIEFSSRGVLRVEIHPDAEDMREMKVCDLDSTDFETIANRGQIAGTNA